MRTKRHPGHQQCLPRSSARSQRAPKGSLPNHGSLCSTNRDLLLPFGKLPSSQASCLGASACMSELYTRWQLYRWTQIMYTPLGWSLFQDLCRLEFRSYCQSFSDSMVMSVFSAKCEENGFATNFSVAASRFKEKWQPCEEISRDSPDNFPISTDACGTEVSRRDFEFWSIIKRDWHMIASMNSFCKHPKTGYSGPPALKFGYCQFTQFSSWAQANRPRRVFLQRTKSTLSGQLSRSLVSSVWFVACYGALVGLKVQLYQIKWHNDVSGDAVLLPIKTQTNWILGRMAQMPVSLIVATTRGPTAGYCIPFFLFGHWPFIFIGQAKGWHRQERHVALETATGAGIGWTAIQTHNENPKFGCFFVVPQLLLDGAPGSCDVETLSIAKPVSCCLPLGLLKPFLLVFFLTLVTLLHNMFLDIVLNFFSWHHSDWHAVIWRADPTGHEPL